MKSEIQDKLHIGYLIPNLSEWEKFVPRWQLLHKYNRKKFVIFAYVDDASARRFFADKCDDIVCVDISEMNSAPIIQLMKVHKLNILVDLSGVKVQKFLDIFARRPSPIQACFVGAFNSTGLRTVDYLLTDKYCDPVDQRADYFVETPYRLPQTHFCYRGVKVSASGGLSPLKTNRYVTFAGLYKFVRLSDDFLRLWREILEAVPDSRLLLKSRIFGSGYGCQETRFRLGRLNFPVERVEFVAANVKDEALYSRVDIVLGTYPQQGGRRVCEALYHGVPVISLNGQRHSGRLDYSILKNIALAECIAFNEDEYVKKAVLLAGNARRLMHLRKILPERMENSALMDERRFVAQVERAYEEIWNAPIEVKKKEALCEEIKKLLLTLSEALLFVAKNIMVEAKEAEVKQIVADIVVGFENIETAIVGCSTLRIDHGDVRELVKRIKELKKLHQAGKYESVQQIIQMRIMKTVEKLKDKL